MRRASPKFSLLRAAACALFAAALAFPVSAAPDPSVPAPTDAEVAARSSALEVAGAFSNSGFKTRDGHACAAVSTKAPQFIQVNLYSGNQYWFIAAAGKPAKRIAVTVFDDKGKFVPTELYENNAQAAAGFSPQASGAYIIRIQELDGDPATVCLLYCYK